jgi:hypothetical protein
MTRRDALIIRAAAVWTVYVWVTRMWNILHDHQHGHGFGFKAVHGVLALISIAFAVAIWRVADRSRARERESVHGRPS